MFSKGLLCLYLFLQAKAVAYDNLAEAKSSEQSSSLFSGQDSGSAAKGNDGNRNNNARYDSNSCIHTADENEEAWWRVNLGFATRINEVQITYRRDFAARFAGFSIFVSNTSDFKTGVKCFKQNGSLPHVETTSYPCTAIGQYVTVYNDRFQNTTYPDDYITDGAVLELCEVEVPGCNPLLYGQSCNNSCFCKGLTCDYKTGKCDGDCQPGYTGEACNTPCDPGYFGDKCLSHCPHCGGDKTCNQSGICTYECEAGYFVGQSPGCPQKCGQCKYMACNEDGTCPNGCKDGYYLSTCNGSCLVNCNNCTQNPDNCLSCKGGYFGRNCSKTCPDNCMDDKCDIGTGHCLACDPGYYGEKCQFQCGQCTGIQCNLDGSCPQECVDGYNSLDCKTRCPNNCQSRCEKQSGKCLSCKNGYFDMHCDVECPRHCFQGKCDMSSGHCLGCEPGHYGNNCTNECLHCGGNRSCNDFGFCLKGCETGYFSDYSAGCRLKRDICREISPDLTLPLVIGISSGLFLGLCFTIINVIWSRRQRSKLYMQSVDKHSTEHAYSDLEPEIQYTNVAFFEELVDLNIRDKPQKGKVAVMKTDST